MRRLLILIIVAMGAIAGCTSPENEGGTAIPAAQSGAPLYDEAVGPSDQETKIDE
jgi:hypothetical protein